MSESSAKNASPQDKQSNAEQTPWEQAAQWFSRSLAAALLMVLPGILGSMLDRRLGTTFLAPIGFGLGLTAGTAGLLVLVKRFSPPARGKPLPWDDEESEQGDLEEEDPPQSNGSKGKRN